ncbi:MAG: carboxypeptidase regulatory-like domain-containing protein [Bacteroidetes bacterium]|nr:carboxypeptidase regulatory-like domain-containing protein [Bacteroidota bacterium]
MKSILYSLLLLLIPVFTLFSQETDVFHGRPEVFFSFNLQDNEEITILSKTVSIDRFFPETGQGQAYANKQEWNAFLGLDIPYKIETPPSMQVKDLKMKDNVNIREISDWNFYPTYDAYIDIMEQFATDFPEICEVFSIGTSVQGRQIMMARITDNPGVREAEPQFLYTSSMHGDELTGYVLMLHLIDHLLTNYGTDPRITGLIDGVEIWINPLANPDGTYAGGNQSVYGATRYNSLGVDINRNFPDPEDGPHPDGNEWQKETEVFMALAEANHFVSSCNIHGGAEVCNYPWDTWAKLSADDNWWVYVCREYADTVHEYGPPGYMNFMNNGITNGYTWYTISGGRQDYMNYFHQCREFTLEISDDKTPPASQLNNFWEYNYRSFLNYIDQNTFGLRGTVTDADSGEPLVAEVFVLNHEEDSSWVYSDVANGNYHRLLFEGTWDVRFRVPGYYPQTFQDVIVNNREATVLDVQMIWMFSVTDEPDQGKISVYPNPVTSGYFILTSEDEIDRVILTTLSGKTIKEWEGNHSNRITLNTEDIAESAYILRVISDKRMITGKILIR